MKLLLRYFVQGCLVIAPVAVTAYLLYLLVTRLDALVPTGVPALGVAVVVVGVTVVGYLSSSLLGNVVVISIDRWMQKLPLVKLVYNAVRDLLTAFVGERRAFDRPVSVQVGSSDGASLLGFLTCDEIPFLSDHVAVYLPQAYNFAGNVVVCRRDRVTALEVDRADLMAFIVSGGVSPAVRDLA